MKNLMFSAIAMAFVFTACNANNNKTSDTKASQLALSQEQVYACSMHPEVTGKKGDKCSKCGMELTVPVKETPKATTATAQKSSVISEIVSNYLVLKNALIKDDAAGAATAGKAIVTAMAKIDMKSLSTDQMKGYMDVADDLKENAEHIGDNAGKIAHQREHFAMLSKDVNDLLKTFGNSGPKLYQDFCPMYNKGKGALWISETKAIQNPYYGKTMMTCGSVKKEI
ncbi:DUF3347 domain-containing protein [Emticicia sp.]|uniref:DUF3347 domain-containing protein n=1 Tax=Emticicia sp. TaxID=1930953 RepID=UPI0037512146